MAPVDLNQWMDFEFNKPRRLQWLKEMGWDQAAIDKMFGIDRHEGMTLTDRRPFSAEKAAHPWKGDIRYSGISSAPRQIGPATKPGIESLKNPYRYTDRPGFGYGATISGGSEVTPPITEREMRRFAGPTKPPIHGYNAAGGAIRQAGPGWKVPRVEGPMNIIHQAKEVPHTKGGSFWAGKTGKPSTEMVKMMLNWENIVKGPKKQLAGQLTSFISKYGMAGIKFMAKLPK